MAAKCFARVPLSGQSCQHLEGSSCDRVVPYNEHIRVFALYIRQNLGIHSWRTVGVLQAGNDLLYDLSRVLSLHATSCAPERNWSLWGQVYTYRNSRSRLGLCLLQLKSSSAAKAERFEKRGGVFAHLAHFRNCQSSCVHTRCVRVSV